MTNFNFDEFTTYRELADSLFDKIKSYDFLEMTEDKAYEIVIGYLRPAIVKFDNCKQDLSDRDNENKMFNFHLTDDTFELLVNYMVVEWLTSNYILTWSALKSSLTSSEFKKIDTKDMLTKTMELRKMLMGENDQKAINKSYKKSELFKICTNGGVKR